MMMYDVIVNNSLVAVVDQQLLKHVLKMLVDLLPEEVSIFTCLHQDSYREPVYQEPFLEEAPGIQEPVEEQDQPARSKTK